MSPQQREALERLRISLLDEELISAEEDALLRSLAEEPQAELVAWAQLGTLEGRSYLRMAYDRSPYPPPVDVQRNLNLVPLYTHPPAKQEPLTEEEIAIALTPVVPGLLIEQASAIESACAKKWGVKL